MKAAKLKIEWFQKEDRRKSLRASICRDGMLHLGKPLRAKLSRSIRVGFDNSALTLVLADGHGDGMDCPACGILRIQALTSKISSTGLRLPVSFLMEEDARTGYLLGRVIPRRKANDDGKLCYDTEQMLILFRPMVNEIACQLGKSTPLAERKAAAVEALCAAAQDYNPGCGDLEAYLDQRVRLMIREQNTQFAKEFSQCSLEQPLSSDAGNGFCLHDTIAAPDSDWADSLDDQMDRERFLEQLSGEQQALIQMLQEGFRIPEIADILGMSQRELRRAASEIAIRKRQFDRDA